MSIITHLEYPEQLISFETYALRHLLRSMVVKGKRLSFLLLSKHRTLGFTGGSHNLCNSSFSDFAISAGCFCLPRPPNRNAISMVKDIRRSNERRYRYSPQQVTLELSTRSFSNECILLLQVLSGPKFSSGRSIGRSVGRALFGSPVEGPTARQGTFVSGFMLISDSCLRCYKCLT